jgi:hypothetical protein
MEQRQKKAVASSYNSPQKDEEEEENIISIPSTMHDDALESKMIN